MTWQGSGIWLYLYRWQNGKVEDSRPSPFFFLFDQVRSIPVPRLYNSWQFGVQVYISQTFVNVVWFGKTGNRPNAHSTDETTSGVAAYPPVGSRGCGWSHRRGARRRWRSRAHWCSWSTSLLLFPHPPLGYKTRLYRPSLCGTESFRRGSRRYGTLQVKSKIHAAQILD